MTLIVSLINADQAIVIADRRLTSDERPFATTNEEYNKLTSFVCGNARMAVAFTGRATTPEGFSTADWLVDALMEAAEPDSLFQPTVEQLRIIATRDIGKLPGENKLTIALSGYIYMDDGFPLPAFAWVSNFQGREWSNCSRAAKPVFEGYYTVQGRNLPGPFYMVRALGATQRLNNPETARDAVFVKKLLEERRPMRAIRDKASEVLDRAGASLGSPGPIGKQRGYIVVPSDPLKNFETGYESDYNKWEVEQPNHVVRRGIGDDIALKGRVFGVVDPTQAPPIAVRRAGRNQPCPCGSGQKYKRCHGRSGPPTISITAGGNF